MQNNGAGGAPLPIDAGSPEGGVRGFDANGDLRIELEGFPARRGFSARYVNVAVRVHDGHMGGGYGPGP